jgi:hypothetical protein
VNVKILVNPLVKRLAQLAIKFVKKIRLKYRLAETLSHEYMAFLFIWRVNLMRRLETGSNHG